MYKGQKHAGSGVAGPVGRALAVPSLLRGACLLVLLAAVGCARTSAEKDAPPVIYVTAPQIGRLLAEGTNTVTVLHFWATWCPPCVEEIPRVVALAKKYRARGVRVLLVSADAPQDRDAVTRFLADHHVDEPTYLADNLNDECIKAVSPKWSGAVPASFFYAADGALAEGWEGAHDLAAFEQVVEKLLHQKKQGASKP